MIVRNLLPLGPIDYDAAWDLQRDLVAQRQRGDIADTLLLLEHAPTVTYGRTARPEHRLLTPDAYSERGIALVATDRGGDVTYHGPGQLVGYPILHLGEGSRDIHRYVRALEEVLLRTAADFGVVGADRAPWHAGIWVGDGYLAALGVRVSRWVTHHGFALNVSDDVRAGMATIVPCGVAGKTVATLSREAGKPIAMADAARCVAHHFYAVFERAIVEDEPADRTVP